MRITYTRDHFQRAYIIQIVIDDPEIIGLPLSININPNTFLSLSTQLLYLAKVAKDLETASDQSTEDNMFEPDVEEDMDETEEEYNEEEPEEDTEEADIVDEDEANSEDTEPDEEYEEDIEEDEDDGEEDSDITQSEGEEDE